MSFSESENYSHSKQPEHIAMTATPPTDSLYLDSDVAREQRVHAEAEMEANAAIRQPEHISMTATPPTDSLYLDSDVAREQRSHAEAEMEANAAIRQPEEQEGLLGGMKNKFDSMATGSSIAEFGNTVSNVAQEKAGEAKDIIMNTAVPAAQGALITVQGHIRSISGGGKGAGETIAEGLLFL
jgi:DNA-dependent RNA polymerase auxiliary subunit epsilon